MSTREDVAREVVRALLSLSEDDLGEACWHAGEGCVDWEDLRAEYEETDEDERGSTQYEMIRDSAVAVRTRLVETVVAHFAKRGEQVG